MTRREAFRRIRQVIGPEVCRFTRPVAKRLRRRDPKGADALFEADEVTDRLRSTLAALLVLHDSKPLDCPNCGVRLPRHSAKCLLWRLLRESGPAGRRAGKR